MGTFQDIQVLKTTQKAVQDTLKGKYEENVMPFVKIIQGVMQSKELDVFEAMKLIKEEDAIYNRPNVPFLFTAAMVEIIEETYFK